jgi:hypothetical protein
MSEDDLASTNNPPIPPNEPVAPSSDPLWNNDPRQTFHRLRDRVIDALAIVCEIYRRAQTAPREEPLANHVGELANPLNQAIVEAQAIWFDTPIADYLERAAPVYLDREGRQTAQGISGSCYHDLALAVASGTLQAIGQGSRVMDYTGKLRGATAAGNFVAGHLASLIPQVRCECQEGIARWSAVTRTTAASMDRRPAVDELGADPDVPDASSDEDEEDQTLTSGDLIPIASDVPDLGTARTVAEFWDWCSRHREGLRQLRVRLGEPLPASIAPDEFRCIPEIVRQCRQYLLSFGASDIPEQFTFAALPTIQTSSGPGYGSSGIEAFVSWASGYRTPGHGVLKLVGDVEDFLTWAMNWCQQQSSRGRGKEADSGDTNNQRGAEQVEESEKDSAVGYKQKFQMLKRSVQLAYLAFEYAESKVGKQLQDQEAYNLLREEGMPGEAEGGERLTGYCLPAFTTWARQLRDARRALGEQKNTSRRGRSIGKSIQRESQIERQHDAEDE